MKKSRKIVIFPILPDRSSTRTLSGNDPEPSIPSLRGYLNTDLSGNNARAVPLDVLRFVFNRIKRIPPGHEPALNRLTADISRALLDAGVWSWQLPELVSDIRRYLDRFREDRLELDEVEREMRTRLLPILEENGLDRSEVAEELVDQIIRVFNSSSTQTSLQEISEKLQDTPAFEFLPEEVVDRCVDEFFDILFSRGYISFSDD